MSSVVTEVEAGKLDPSWVGQLFEVVEETRDGPVRTGFRLRGYAIPGEGGGKVRLVTEWSTLAVDPGTKMRCFAVAAVPDRWTGVLPPSGGAPAYPPPVQQPQQPVQPVPGYPVPVASGGPAAAAYPPPAPPVQPVAGAGGGGRPVAPAGPPPWQQPGPAQGGWAQPGGQ